MPHTFRALLRTPLLAALLLTLPILAQAQQTDGGWNGKVQPPQYKETIFPPWQHGANNPALDKGLEFTVPEVNDLPDFHGNLDHPKLVIFVAGNYYFAMAPLVQAFEKEHPQYQGRVFYETLPPGILLKQMRAGGVITVGNMTWTVKPDVFAAGLKKVQAGIRDGILTGKAIPYVSNDLTIMVPKGNPAHITGLADLGKPGVTLSMPNPKWEGVARQIEASLRKAGGEQLEQMVYDTKVKNGQTVLTHIHHRQTPLYLMQGVAQAGVTWKSEAIFQEQAGHPISHVDIPADQNTTAVYAAAVVKGAAHPQAGLMWAEFLRSPAALRIFERYGFKPAPSKPVS
jgi:ABC-type molybdate transport system substrate-binding protein